jgi:8-oxo-dGTP diphosphatase
MKRISARAIIIEGDKIGLMYRKKVNHAFYCLPGGKQESGEKLEETVVREIKEEFGIDIEVVKKVYEFVSESAHQHFYLCKWVDGIFGTGEGEEFTLSSEKGYYEPRLVNIEHLKELHILPKKLAKQLRKDYETNGENLRDDVKIFVEDKPTIQIQKVKLKKRKCSK